MAIYIYNSNGALYSNTITNIVDAIKECPNTGRIVLDEGTYTIDNYVTIDRPSVDIFIMGKGLPFNTTIIINTDNFLTLQSFHSFLLDNMSLFMKGQSYFRFNNVLHAHMHRCVIQRETYTSTNPLIYVDYSGTSYFMFANSVLYNSYDGITIQGDVNVYSYNNYYKNSKVWSLYGLTMPINSVNDFYHDTWDTFSASTAGFSHNVYLRSAITNKGTDPVIVADDATMLTMCNEFNVETLAPFKVYIPQENGLLYNKGIKKDFMHHDRPDFLGNPRYEDGFAERGIIKIKKTPVSILYPFKITEVPSNLKGIVRVTPAGLKYREGTEVTVEVDAPSLYKVRSIKIDYTDNTWENIQYKTVRSFKVTSSFSLVENNIVIDYVSLASASEYKISPLWVYNDIDNTIFIEGSMLSYIDKVRIGTTEYKCTLSKDKISFTLPKNVSVGIYSIYLIFKDNILPELDTKQFIDIQMRPVLYTYQSNLCFINQTSTIVVVFALKNNEDAGWQYITSDIYLAGLYTRWSELTFKYYSVSGATVDILYSIDKNETFIPLHNIVIPIGTTSAWKQYIINFNVVSATISFKYIVTKGGKIKDISVGYVEHSKIRSFI